MSTIVYKPRPNNPGDQPGGKKLSPIAKIFICLLVVIILGVISLAALGKGFIKTVAQLTPEPTPEKVILADSDNGMVPHKLHPNSGVEELYIDTDREALVPSEETLAAFLKRPLDSVLTTFFWASLAGVFGATPFCFRKCPADIPLEEDDDESDGQNTNPDPDDE